MKYIGEKDIDHIDLIQMPKPWNIIKNRKTNSKYFKAFASQLHHNGIPYTITDI